MKFSRTQILRYGALLAIAALALGLRLYAARSLRIDVDEPTYLTTAVNYADALRQGAWANLTTYSYNSEHPSFYKVVYGVAELTQRPIPSVKSPKIQPYESIRETLSRRWVLVGRYASAGFSSLAVLALGVVNPLAGLLLALQTLGIKYTSSFYLEGLPFLTSLLAGLAYLAWFRRARAPRPARRVHLWLLSAAVLLGMTAASKYVYLVVGLAIAIHFAIYAVKDPLVRRNLGWMASFLAAALVSFYLFDTYLWTQPVEKLVHSLTYLTSYSGSASVAKSGYPVYQPLLWLFKSYPAHFPYDRASFVLDLDVPISVLAVIGAYRLYKKNPFFFIWLILGLAILLAWPTKWPQYTLIILAPLCLSASEGLAWLYSVLIKTFRPLRTLRSAKE